MRQALEDFEHAVRNNTQETLDRIERELDYILPWNHPGAPETDEEDDEEDDEGDDEDEGSPLSFNNFW
ncbi:hypothetical protein ColLi_09043 [Colletotrichum liriopes]|uniref:Uncharacterized protein n=1 Tax=Colletotrichum liriopes TaxID=708192 RepID=A0AA37GSY4_9PEZI|nr:hypothetical protein ColLi_09043 [Colletotrichum liriopes]